MARHAEPVSCWPRQSKNLGCGDQVVPTKHWHRTCKTRTSEEQEKAHAPLEAQHDDVQRLWRRYQAPARKQEGKGQQAQGIVGTTRRLRAMHTVTLLDLLSLGAITTT